MPDTFLQYVTFVWNRKGIHPIKTAEAIPNVLWINSGKESQLNGN